FIPLIHPPQQHDECGKRSKQAEIGSLSNSPTCVERVDHVRVNFDSAHLLSTCGEWCQPLISETFRREPDQDDLIFELPRVCAAIEDFPRRHMPERVLVTRESNVHHLRANQISRTHFLFEVRFE